MSATTEKSSLPASAAVSKPVGVTVSLLDGPKKKICCACPDTKKLRDDCIARNGPDQCSELINLHKACLRSEGFNI